jgi:hypothetical protein
MIRHHRLDPRFVEDIPEQLDSGVIYVSMRCATAVHLCCCGCAREVVTPLAPAQWKLTFDGENISLHPSIGSWNLPCRSHYFIRGGAIVEAPSWSDEDAARGQAHDKRARDAYYGAKGGNRFEPKSSPHAAQQRQRGWLARLGDLLFSRR